MDPKFIDREKTEAYTLCVNASASSVNASTGADQWKVVVNVREISDHQVRFVQSSVSTGEQKLSWQYCIY